MAGLLAYALVSSFADISLDEIANEFKNADKVWLWAALFDLPPLWGTFAMRWMKRHSYV